MQPVFVEGREHIDLGNTFKILRYFYKTKSKLKFNLMRVSFLFYTEEG